jgi:hypothetical protein
MYLVDPDIFKQFLDKNKLAEGYIPNPANVPCIIEFNRDNVIAAKVEVLSINEFSHVVKQGSGLSGIPKNKYWIRGKEWEKDGNGNQIKELNI